MTWHLQGPVTVRYDERGVPHIRAENEADLYRALGYVHAQDRLFQMEMMRRLAQGELAEVLGPKLVDTDRLFRTLGIRARAETYVAALDQQTPAWKALKPIWTASTSSRPATPNPWNLTSGHPQAPVYRGRHHQRRGYLAYSFAAAFRTEPVLTYVRDQLGDDYLKVFDLDWHPKGALGPAPGPAASDWKA